MAKKDIIIKLSILYSQKQKRISKKISYTIMDMTNVIIIDEKIDNNLWCKVILIMTQVKNIRLTKTFRGNSLY